jgi:replicative DNA helicase
MHPLKTGIPKFDRLKILRRGRLSLVGGRPSSGITDLAEIAALGLLSRRKLKKGVAWAGPQFRTAGVWTRLLARVAKVSHQRVNTGKLSMAELKWLQECNSRLARLPLTIDHWGNLSVQGIESRLRELQGEGKRCDLLVIDHLEQIRGQRKLQDLRALSERMNCAILILFSLDQKADARSKGEPRMADLSCWAQARSTCDTIGFLYGSGKARKLKVVQQGGSLRKLEVCVGRELEFDDVRRAFSGSRRSGRLRNP